jgi:hypothetical protein
MFTASLFGPCCRAKEMAQVCPRQLLKTKQKSVPSARHVLPLSLPCPRFPQAAGAEEQNSPICPGGAAPALNQPNIQHRCQRSTRRSLVLTSLVAYREELGSEWLVGAAMCARRRRPSTSAPLAARPSKLNH